MKNIDIIAACSDLGVHVKGSQFGSEILINNILKPKFPPKSYIYYNF